MAKQITYMPGKTINICTRLEHKHTVSYMDIHTLIDIYIQYMQPIQVCNQISDISPLKNQISDPPNLFKYQIFDPPTNQISDI